MEEAKDPDTDHLYQLYSLFVDDAARQEMADLYRRGGFGYGQVKKAVADAAEAYFAPAARVERNGRSDPIVFARSWRPVPLKHATRRAPYCVALNRPAGCCNASVL